MILTQFPDTSNQWMSPMGFPLLQIRTIGPDAIAVDSRPTGMRSVTDLQLEGERAAYQVEVERYFQGDAAGTALEASLAVTGNIPVPAPDATDLQRQTYQDSLARQVSDKAVFDKVTSTGKYLTSSTAPSIAAPPIAGVSTIVDPSVSTGAQAASGQAVVEVNRQAVEAVALAASRFPSYHPTKPFWLSLIALLDDADIATGDTALLSVVKAP